MTASNNEERTCYDCHNFRVKIPLAKPKNSKEGKTQTARQILTLRLNYNAAKAYCRRGHLLKNADDEDRIFKNVLKSTAKTNLLAYQAAHKCPDYELDE
ncbi:MAG TPA: hypothetical protein PK114_04505 [Smithellaceae bacterium]|nr:hypothetical protein [Smithellaceae bacterium]HPK53698.1 hypothetical protein [Smithellaceae bacterium]HRS98126.1 hypothetical protein [Smithella sp.]